MSNKLPSIHVPEGLELRRNKDGKFYFAPKNLGYSQLVTAHTKTYKTVKSSMSDEQKETLFGKEEMAAIEDNNEKRTSKTKGRSNSVLAKAKRDKNDEFYTRLEDVDAELRYYKDFLKGKSIYCPCDKFIKDGRSMFVEYFCQHFFELNLKDITISYFDENGHGHATHCTGDLNGDGVINADDFQDIELAGDGSFDSYECKELMKKCDVVVTNPPFSLFRTFVRQILSFGKKFIIIGNQNAITYKEIFPLIKENKIWLGYNFVKQFYLPDNSIKSFGNISWFTNFDIEKRHQMLPLCRTYYDDKNAYKHYPKYDNYDAIECSKIKNIPMDYDGVIGVPITFLNKYCPEQFEIIKFRKGNDDKDLSINGKCPYFRILIRRRHSI